MDSHITGIPEDFVEVNAQSGGTANFQTIQDACSNWTGQGNYLPILVVGEHRIDSTIVLPDRDIRIYFAPGAKIIPSGNIEIFSLPNGATAKRHLIFYNMVVEGDPTKTQKLFAYKDTNASYIVETWYTETTGIRVVDDIQASDESWHNVLRIRHHSPRFSAIAALGVCKLAQTPSAHGDYLSGISIHYYDSLIGAEAVNWTYGWSWDVDADMIFHGTCIQVIDGDIASDGLQGDVMCQFTYCGASAAVIQYSGFSWDSGLGLGELYLNNTGGGTLELILSGGYATGRLTLIDNVTLTVSSRYNDVNVICLSAHIGTRITISEGAYGNKIRGRSASASVAVIKIRGTRNVIDTFHFENDGGGKTILEEAPANLNVAMGCIGISEGTGFTKVGAGSLIAVGGTNIA